MKQTWKWFILAALVFVLAACSGEEASDSAVATDSGQAPSTASSDTPQEKLQLTVAVPFVLGAPSGAPMWLGEGLGFFEEEGVDVEIVAIPGKPAEAIGLVVAGKADLAISQPDALVFPLAEGNDQGLKWVFTPYQGPIFGISVEEAGDIQSPKDLEGKTVAMQALGAPFETFMQANVTSDGGDASKVKTVQVGSLSAGMEAMKKGDIDAFVSNQGDAAIAALATDTVIRTLAFPGEVADGFAAGFVMNEDTSDEKKEAIVRYIRGVIKSAIVAQENPDKAIEANWAMYPTSKPTENVEQATEEAKVSLGVSVSNYKKADNGQWGYISPERWGKFVENNGLTEGIPDVNVLFDYSLLEQFNDFDEEAVRAAAKQ
ncbi:MAG: ABC transporter substrate-binding protein [Solibacillus sp.]